MNDITIRLKDLTTFLTSNSLNDRSNLATVLDAMQTIADVVNSTVDAVEIEDAETTAIFIVTTRERLDRNDRIVANLSKTTDFDESIDELYRNYHTIKGEAALLGLPEIVGLAHFTEGFLEIRRVTAIEPDILVKSNEIISKMISNLENALNDREKRSETVCRGLSDKTVIASKELRSGTTTVEKIFERMVGLAEKLADDGDKSIDVAVNGMDVELDTTVVDSISVILMHMMRNAVDHGVESPRKRVEAGKPIAGRIILRAYREKGSLVVELEDDGNGLDEKRILKRAIDRGIINAEEAIELDERAVHHLIFEPGLSTAAVVTEVSGRGVGMDVVKRTVTCLGGTVEVRSISGKGTTFCVKIPLDGAMRARVATHVPSKLEVRRAV